MPFLVLWLHSQYSVLLNITYTLWMHLSAKKQLARGRSSGYLRGHWEPSKLYGQHWSRIILAVNKAECHILGYMSFVLLALRKSSLTLWKICICLKKMIKMHKGLHELYILSAQPNHTKRLLFLTIHIKTIMGNVLMWVSFCKIIKCYVYTIKIWF